MRTPKDKGGYQYAVLVTTLMDLEPAALADAYDGRATIEASFCQDKQALGLVTRRQHRWEAQQMVLLLARLAHHLLLWGKQWLRQVPTTRRRLQGYGLVRLLRDVWAVRLDGQRALLTPSSARNPASGKLFRALSWTCASGYFALKTGS
jgi:hypothetical protein